jgi:hypothetical protein
MFLIATNEEVSAFHQFKPQPFPQNKKAPSTGAEGAL